MARFRNRFFPALFLWLTQQTIISKNVSICGQPCVGQQYFDEPFTPKFMSAKNSSEKKTFFFVVVRNREKKRVKGAFHKQAIRFVARLTGERSREWGRWKRSIAGEKTKLVGRPLVRWFQCRSVLLRPKGYRTAALTHFLNENSPLGTDAGSQKKKLTGDKQVDQYINRFFW